MKISKTAHINKDLNRHEMRKGLYMLMNCGSKKFWGLTGPKLCKCYGTKNVGGERKNMFSSSGGRQGMQVALE